MELIEYYVCIQNRNKLLWNIGEWYDFMGNQRKQEGFTLLEVLLILCLMMVIIGIASPRWSSAENYTSTQGDLANRVRIEGAVELYKLDTGMLPEGIDDLYSPPPGIKGWRGPYLRQDFVKPTRNGESYELNERGKVIP
ncbi:MAG TPA: hypothetical protein GX523_12125 [Desulfitobacterium dehalogenans]|uniref:Type II secretion system protein GspG C-terminal domain-containing protein n=1 Tax=Desulfitobacterium dehalogenans TaxID=36854 RepID=A0A7C6Z518_9FIRM|nr:hypothetical protein [Desulfitobacterium dehalogenans]